MSFKDLRNSFKNTKLYLIDELWQNNLQDKKTIINVLKDEKLMAHLKIDTQTDEFLQHINNPGNFKNLVSGIMTDLKTKNKLTTVMK